MKWNVDYEEKDSCDRGDLYTLEVNGKIVAKFSDKGGWGRGIQLANKKGKLVYTQTVNSKLSLEETKKAIEERIQRRCPECNGLGKWIGYSFFRKHEITCKYCQGKGLQLQR